MLETDNAKPGQDIIAQSATLGAIVQAFTKSADKSIVTVRRDGIVRYATVA